jgi:hypothetical protein
VVDGARRQAAARDARRRAQEAAYRFILAMAGNEPGFEGAVRALFAGRAADFAAAAGAWPPDIREQADALAAKAFKGEPGGAGRVSREWRAVTSWDVADEYAAYLCREVQERCRVVPGNRGVLIRRYREGPVAVFLLTTVWESEDALRRAFGDDWERSLPLPDENRFGVHGQEYVQPAEVLACRVVAEPEDESGRSLRPPASPDPSARRGGRL